jgi:hypothetical protein
MRQGGFPDFQLNAVPLRILFLMSKRIYKKVTGWSLFLEESKEANPDPNKSAQQFKAEM